MMNGYEYEQACARYLKKNGFVKIEVTKASGDQGIDVIAYKDKKSMVYSVSIIHNP